MGPIALTLKHFRQNSHLKSEFLVVKGRLANLKKLAYKLLPL